jgi:hypothetical protein
MIKILSVKTRREGSTRAEFRRYYEGHHIPLGLGFIDRFRWRKYVRNHVMEVHAGAVDFDCLTEFWVASREDQESTQVFAASPAFRVLDDDDPRFLDVSRRLACELQESLIAGARPPLDPPGTRRMAAIFSRPPAIEAGMFAKSISAEVRRLSESARGDHPGTRVTLDLRATSGPRPDAFAAIVSTWAAPGTRPPRLSDWRERAPDAEVELDVVETPAERLWSAAQERRGGPESGSGETGPPA